jgi:serine protease Do
MKKMLYSMLALSLAACTQVKAQDAAKEKKEIIVQEKSSGKNEKLVLVIDGDKVTINGKPAEDYKGKKRIIIDDNIFINGSELHIPRNGELFVNGDDNKALLGVVTEKAENGALVKDVTKESAAEKAGLRKGDIITKLNDKDIKDHAGLAEIVGDLKPNDIADITYLRDGKEKKVKATLGKSKAHKALAWNFDGRNKHYDFRYEPPLAMVGPKVPLPPFSFNDDDMWAFRDDRPKFGMSVEDYADGDGVKITALEDESYAAKSGLKENDVITEADGKTVKNVDDLKDVLKDIKEKTSIAIKVLRNGVIESLTLKLPKIIRKAEL